MTFDIESRIAALPSNERVLIEQWLDYHLAVLAVMPASQRFDAYARAQIAMAHHERFSRELDPSVEARVVEASARQ